MAGRDVTVLVLGASGMLGNAVLRLFAGSDGIETWGTVRSVESQQHLPSMVRERVIFGVDTENGDCLTGLLGRLRPQVVINCIGAATRHGHTDTVSAISLNGLLPHRLALLCRLLGARLVHISSDGVFSGTRGMYREEDIADAQEVYGRTKFLGEVDYPNAVTLRTSIIGHEFTRVRGLIGWFLAQSGPVSGFRRAIFSGLPTVELARVIRDCVLPHVELQGVYHVSSDPISKYELLRLVAQVYGKTNEITPDDRVVIDRSLDSSRFRSLTGYQPPAWPELVRAMHEFG
jgi:dTDP-4-dehydrorhamnose reductase